MKFLLFSDVHGDIPQCDALVKKSRHVDMVLGAGDFGLFRKGVAKTIASLSRISKPTLLVHGNHENHDELANACATWKSARILHGTSIEIDGITFFGMGGATPVTPFVPWSVDVSEKEAGKMLAMCPEKSILISHSPPFQCLDAINPKQHLGSKSIRKFIEEKKPLFVVCGHIHEEQNKKSSINGIPIINAGPAGMIYELGK